MFRKKSKTSKSKSKPEIDIELDPQVEAQFDPEPEPFADERAFVDPADFFADSYTPTPHRKIVGMFEVSPDSEALIGDLNAEIQRFESAKEQFERQRNASFNAAAVARNRRDFEVERVTQEVIEATQRDNPGIGRLYGAYEDGYVIVRRDN